MDNKKDSGNLHSSFSVTNTDLYTEHWNQLLKTSGKTVKADILAFIIIALMNLEQLYQYLKSISCISILSNSVYCLCSCILHTTIFFWPNSPTKHNTELD